MDWRSVSIAFLEIPQRAHTVFTREGIANVGQIDDMTNARLGGLRQLGPLTVRQIREAVEQARKRYHETGYPPQEDRDRWG